MNTYLDRTPVIVGVGEITQRTKDPAQAKEPLKLMEAALRAADKDAGANVLGLLDSLEVIQEFSWPYVDAPGQLAELLRINPTHRHYGPVGGETPVKFIHEAALRILRGDCEVAAVVGAEAQYAVTAATKNGFDLPWSPIDPDARLIRGTNYLNPVAVTLGVASPAHVYPFYENAALAAWGQTPAAAAQESSELWARNSVVARDNPYAWNQQSFSAEEIVTPAMDNRLVAWPYTKRMVANPQVNQGAAILLTSLGRARQLGIPSDRLVHIWCGAAAQEPADYLDRDQYTRAAAQDAVLNGILGLVGDAGRFGVLELYSCFPIVPKMARRILALAPDSTVTCTGGLSFFGAPLNNYMTHATATMVRKLRGQPKSLGLLYGQGGYLTKHHAIVLGSLAPQRCRLTDDYSVQSMADASRGPTPPLALAFTGRAAIETFTVLYARDGSVVRGVVIARTPEGARLLAGVEARDERSISALTNAQRSPIGCFGDVTLNTDGLQIWSVSS
ncbi:acetyl-CoA C-acetyltransferase [Pseudomonas sp. SJZ103]|uniref:acetyl-CoA acetyltransferase n=1 Tax=unclassified Pseudomonas TaxID=196821 RepID=UPI0011A4BF6C|nr:MULTISPECIES: acetyl-CoA acetyltransferase [unclassified Pseudomonas]MBB6290530.1 acetyl-CoA acetyltransferase [Pseudomonas sp. SJZ073]MBB6315743.1 acetyl-CoA acetyltransferase [Pseudomonas sp. JAI120]TWC63141.1 acetyl-CoA C-acetyltransferase [Pseudomonas sp. SJZ103]TWC80170.1 acetyl-CoA C-acetyltransferase [Pseudomonas sp. SJZ094]